MAKKMLIDATHAEETRVVVVDGNKVEEFDFEAQAKRQLAGNIYLAKVTRVEPSLQAAFVDYGGNRHGFLAFSEIHPDYYQIPVADREALLAEERAYAEAQRAEDEEEAKPKTRKRSRSRSRAKSTDTSADAVTTAAPEGMETIDLAEDSADEAPLVEDVTADAAAEPAAETVASQSDEQAEAATDEAAAAEDAVEVPGDDEDDKPYVALDDAAEKDETIDVVADDDVEDDVRPVRKVRPRKYKIQEVIKVRQIMLVQVVKEERGNKGAALTTYLSLAGRYCVLMPNTARGGGISRKITNAADRKKLKEIASSLDVPQGAGLIIRTAGSQRTKTEIKRDYEYLQRLWEQIRELTLKSIAPAPIYEEGNLIKRSIRDLYSKEIDEVIVEGEAGYRTAKDFMKMIMPSHAKNVKHYQDPLPLFARYQVESYLNSMFNPVVQLPSGGYIVIGVTEALVAIDVNSGRATKEGSIEQTALKTNLEAAEEIARQLRLRDLAGLIVIDFIDMDERKNNAAVEKRFKEKLKTDRARIQVGRISGFGLLEMSRQRLRPGMLEATTQPCPHCHGTGLLRSDDNVALSILRALEEEGVRGKSREVLVKAPVAIANFLMNQKREHVAQIEQRFGMAVRIEGTTDLVSPDFTLEKFKTATRTVAEAPRPVISSDMIELSEVEEEEAPEEVETAEALADEGEKPKKKRRRRRRKKSGGGDATAAQSDAPEGEGPQPSETVEADPSVGAAPDGAGTAEAEPDAAEAAPAEEGQAEVAEEDAPKKKRSRTRSRSRSKKSEAVAENPETATAQEAPATAEAQTEAVETAEAQAPEADAEVPTQPEEEAPAKKPRRRRSVSKEKAVAPEPEVAEATGAEEAAPAAEPTPEPASEAEPAPAEPEPAVAPAAETVVEEKPKRRGWWSLSRG